MNRQQEIQALTRRNFLGRAFLGTWGTRLGVTALASLLHEGRQAGAQSQPGADRPDTERYEGVVRPLHFPARAKRVIYLYMAGGPSHLETFDPKPVLAKMHGRAIP